MKKPIRLPTDTLRNTGFSLVEILIVLTILGIMAGMAAVNMAASVPQSLQGTAQVIVGEVAYARSLAVTNNSTYQLAFDTATNRFTLTHIGSNPAFNNLPYSVFRSPQDTATQHIVDLASLPQLGSGVHLHGVLAMSTILQSVTTLAFGPLGETTRTDTTVIWLRAGTGTNARYMSVSVNPVTGLTTIGPFQADAPAGL